MNATSTRILAAITLACIVASARGEETDDLEQMMSTPVYAASKYRQSVAQAPAAVTVLTQGDIRSFGWRTLGEILNGVRGVFTRYDRTYTYVNVRGFGRPGDFSSRLLLLIDGVRANENVYESVLVGREFPIDVALIERVEFIPGPNSVLYGPNAVLGTINVVTRSAASLRGQTLATTVDSQRSGKVQFSSGHEFLTGSLVVAATAENRPGTDLRLPAFDPSGGDGLVRGLDGERDRKLSVRWSGQELALSAIVSERAKSVPNAPFGLVFGTPSVWTDRMTLVGGTWQRLGSDGTGWSFQTGIGQYEYHDFGRYEPDRLMQTYRNQGHWWQGELRRTIRLSDAQLLLVGAEFQRNFRQRNLTTVFDVDGPLVGDVSTDSTRFGYYITDEISLTSTLKLGLGARLDKQTNDQWHATPRMSMVWDVTPDWVLKALAGEAYRPANFFERAPAVAGDPWNNALLSERMRSYELVSDWRATERLRLSTSLYDNLVRNMIEQVLIEDGSLAYRNLGAARAKGIELEAEYLSTGGSRLRTSLTRQKVRLEDGMEPSNSPGTLLKVHATTPIPGAPLRLGVEVLGVGARYTLLRERLESRLLANTTLLWDPPGRKWSLAASIYNVANRKVADPAGPEFLSDRIVQDGRVYTLRWVLGF